jgi:hypothetical protein
MNSIVLRSIFHPAQQDNCFTSLVKAWAQSLSPSTKAQRQHHEVRLIRG